MLRRFPKPTTTIFAAISAILFISSAGSVGAQVGGSPPPLRTEREQTMSVERDKLTRGPDTEQRPQYSRFPAGARPIRTATAAAEIKKDAERVQFFNTEMMRTVSASAPPDYDRIIKATGEIKKHARRLMFNLRLPWIKKAAVLPDGQAELNDKELVASLKKLDELVKSLSANPLLVNRNVVDVHQASAAGRDLEAIIVLSEYVRKNAKRLRRQTGH